MSTLDKEVNLVFGVIKIQRTSLSFFLGGHFKITYSDVCLFVLSKKHARLTGLVSVEKPPHTTILQYAVPSFLEKILHILLYFISRIEDDQTKLTKKFELS